MTKQILFDGSIPADNNDRKSIPDLLLLHTDLRELIAVSCSGYMKGIHGLRAP
ncbi:hypothetical protein [Tunturiibacter gelidiferens]|uniref:Uncharacterized protein n=1 Tax=Tunturiibacter gelidiferens TaxID=3069689 RepID=A0AAU7Z4Q5_9BACT